MAAGDPWLAAGLAVVAASLTLVAAIQVVPLEPIVWLAVLVAIGCAVAVLVFRRRRVTCDPQGLSIQRGPVTWHREWSEISRLVWRPSRLDVTFGTRRRTVPMQAVELQQVLSAIVAAGQHVVVIDD